MKLKNQFFKKIEVILTLKGKPKQLKAKGRISYEKDYISIRRILTYGNLVANNPEMKARIAQW